MSSVSDLFKFKRRTPTLISVVGYGAFAGFMTFTATDPALVNLVRGVLTSCGG